MGDPAVGGTVLRRVLDNGLTVVLKEDHRSPVVALHLWVKTGSVFEQEYAGTGISHFVEHMLFKGTERRGVGKIAQEIQACGGEINAHTSLENTVYTLQVPKEHCLEALDILADAAVHPAFDPQEFAKEKDVILKEINMRDDDPESYLSRMFWSTAYAVHPARDPVIWHAPLFQGLTREDLLAYYRTRYTPNNMVLVAAGDFSAASLFSQIEKLFGNVSRHSGQGVLLPAEPRQLGPRRLEQYRDLGQAYVLIGFHGPALTDTDMEAMDVLSILLGEGRSSRLYQEAREKQGLVSGIASWSYTPSFPGVFAIMASLDPAKIEALRALIWKELNALKTRPVDAAELEKAKAQTISEYYHSLETASGQASDLGTGEVFAHDPEFTRRYVQRVAAVSPQDIQRVARAYLTEDASNEVLLLPKQCETAATVPSGKTGSEPVISKHVLDNGARVLIREDHSLPLATVKVLFKGGLLTETKKDNGLCNLFSQMFLQGTRKRSSYDIVKELETGGGGISSHAGNNSFGFSISLLSKHLPRALALAGEILREPAFFVPELEKEKSAISLDIKALEDQVFQTACKLFRETMFAGHPYQFVTLGSLDSVPNLTREDLLRYQEKYVTGPNMVVAVFGDVSTEKVLADLRRSMGAVPGRAVEFPAAALPAWTQPEKVSKTQEGKQAFVLLGYPTAGIDDPDRYVLEVLESLLSGQSARLFETLREKHALAYMVGCFQMVGLDTGAFVFYTGTVPQSVDFVVEELFKEIEKIRDGDVDPAELARAKNGLRGQRKMHLQTNAQLALQTGLDELYGLGWDDYTKYDARISAVTGQDIRRVARRFFDNRRYVLSVVTPPAKSPAAGTAQ